MTLQLRYGMLSGRRASQYCRVKQAPGKWVGYRKTRREEVVMNRLRMAHTRLTHGYLFCDNPEREICRWFWDAYMSVEHVLVTCPNLDQQRVEVIRPQMGGEITIQKLLRETANHKIVVEYLTKLSVLDEI